MLASLWICACSCLIPSTQLPTTCVAVAHTLPAFLLLQMENLQVLMPASSESKRGTVKRAMKKEAVLIHVKELQLCMPGTCRHLAEEVSEVVCVCLCVLRASCM